MANAKELVLSSTSASYCTFSALRYAVSRASKEPGSFRPQPDKSRRHVSSGSILAGTRDRLLP